LVLEILILLFLDLVGRFNQGEAELLAALVRVAKLVLDIMLLALYVFIELELLIESVHSRLEVVVVAAQLRFIVFNKRAMLRRSVHQFKADVVGLGSAVRRREDQVTGALDRAHTAQVLGEAASDIHGLA